MRTLTTTAVLLLFVLSGAQLVEAQNVPNTGTFGIKASVQSTQTDLEFPIWVQDNISIAPLVGIVTEEDNFTQFRLGVKPRFYQDMGSNFGTYLGAQGVFTNFKPSGVDGDSNFLIGALAGGEYFLDSHFSLGVEGQLNLLVDDQNVLSTGAALTGTYYF